MSSVNLVRALLAPLASLAHRRGLPPPLAGEVAPKAPEGAERLSKPGRSAIDALDGKDAVEGSGDAAALAFVPGFFRNTLFFTFSLRYPDRVAGEVPQRRANSVRADRKDLSPVGAEPVIPDAAEPQEGEDSGDR